MGEEIEATKRAVQEAMQHHSKLVVGDDHRRQQECMNEINASLKKHRCAIVPRAILSQQGVEFVLETHVVPEVPEAEDASKTGQVSKEGKGESRRKRKKR